MCAAGTLRDGEDWGLRFHQTMVAMVAFFFFQTAGKFSTLVAPIVILTEADKRFEVVLISKKGCLRLDSIKKKKRQEMRVEDGSGAVCCVQAKVFEFSCWESEGIHSFHPEHSRNGEKGTI